MNKLFPRYKEALLGSGVNLVSGAIKAQLVDTGAYTQSDSHQFLSSVPAAARVGAAVTLASKTVTGGVFDAADVTFSSVPAGSGTADKAEALIIFRDSGTEGTSELIAYIDTATGLPITPNGGNVSVAWDAAGIFAL